MKRSGFTLIETIVAIALFSTAVAIAVGGFTNALRTQRQAQGLLATESNVGLALEQVAREVRTGNLFCHDVNSAQATSTCGCVVNGQTWTCNALAYETATGQGVVYSLANGALQRTVAGVTQPITGDNVSVKYLHFILFGNISGDHWTPRITMTIGIAPSSTDPGIANTVLSLETSISAREIDCDTTSGVPVC